MLHRISLWLRHFFHVVSNIRPIVWIGLYILLMPIFALIYQALPDGQFRIPDGGTTDFGSWLYYSIVTITTLGFGDYTPARGMAQCVTAVEVMCGLVFLGLFLNAVGSMKSEIDVESEIEKQRRLRDAAERDKLVGLTPTVLAILNRFVAVTEDPHTTPHAVLRAAARVSLALDNVQSRVDLSQWPKLLEDCFTFVADYQLHTTTEADAPAEPSTPSADITTRLRTLALDIETQLNTISTPAE